jgi:pimeloyl-ACP methyl ester carboxylesterase
MDIVIENLFPDQADLAVPSYFVKSTAPRHVEDRHHQVDRDRPMLQDVVKRLYDNHSRSQQETGVVIAIHGYNTGSADEHETDAPICQDPNRFVFLGYRWPSESVMQKNNLKNAFRALPFLLKTLLLGGFGVAVLSFGLLLAIGAVWWALPLAIGVFGFALVICLVLLRFSVYFRDSYRASYFGVNDLVELIRQLDQGLVQQKMADLLTDQQLYDRVLSDLPALQGLDYSAFLGATQTIRRELGKRPDLIIQLDDLRFQQFVQRLQAFSGIDGVIAPELLPPLVMQLEIIQAETLQQAQIYWKRRPIKLSFIGHSMGAHVTTQTIRILSDVFDPRSIGKLGDQSEKMPSSRVGRVFCLGRLVLVSPDIPLLTITSGRSNFLRSSLRRFEEAYLFSNEGDLALRLASTAANYFSFPARTRTQGYRLGNVTIKANGASGKNRFGIANLDNPMAQLLPYLEVNVLNQRKSQTLDPSPAAQARRRQELKDEAVMASDTDKDEQSLADLFTYFDCTEYRDFTDYNARAREVERNVMILNGQRSPLKLFGYIRLFLAFIRFSPRSFPKGRDVHGGYFWGKLSKLLVYRLVFLGFSGLLDSLEATPLDRLGIASRPAQFASTQDATADGPTGSRSLPEKRQEALRYLAWLCQQKSIQAVISPERYQVDILGIEREEVREEMLLREKRVDRG